MLCWSFAKLNQIFLFTVSCNYNRLPFDTRELEASWDHLIFYLLVNCRKSLWLDAGGLANNIGIVLISLTSAIIFKTGSVEGF